jgi:8-oxo-dGTP pyrophosphatase MutT (NUDIX family)
MLNRDNSVPEKSPWTSLSSRMVHATAWLKLYEDRVVKPGGKEGLYTYTVCSGFVLMVPRNERGELLLVRQFRYPVGLAFWEFPAGFIDEGEEPKQSAARELGEETGLQAASWREIGRVYEDISLSRHEGTVLLAEGLAPAPDKKQDDEGISQQQWFSMSALDQLIRDGELTCSKTLAALSLLRVANEG